MRIARILPSFTLGIGLLASPVAFAATTTLYSEGFEVSDASFPGAVRTATGTGGVASATGSFHGIVNEGDFTRFGGYNFGAGNVPTAFQEFWTSLDIYLDLNAGWTNDTRFDYTAAVSASGGGHRRDFIFNGGFYNDAIGPGSGNRFVFSTSNNSVGWPKNPARNPIVISSTGWYTFEHHFFNNAGVLAVEMKILNASDVLQGSWTLSDASDIMAAVGGSRYGWFPALQGGQTLAVDNAELRIVAPSVPETSTTVLLLSGALAGLFALRRRFLRI